jgi:formylglycine-generating enzyme required for sulfatase activity
LSKKIQNSVLSLFLSIVVHCISTQYIFAAVEIKCDGIFSIQKDKIPFESISPSKINTSEFISHTEKGLLLVPEFQFLKETAEKMGIRVWLFGGTAASFLHYVKWDLDRSKGLMNLQADRFDYDYTNIFRSTQDLDIVVDATPEVAKLFQDVITEKFPHFLGAKTKWEVRSLRHRMGAIGQASFKEALLNDSDFNNQNTDSNSIGMIEITSSATESRIRDLKNWDKSSSLFLKDTIENQITFLKSKNHFSTFRAKAGENPEILSVIRMLVKAFQYELTFSQDDFNIIKTIISDFDGRKITNNTALRRIHDTAKKLVMHAVNIEYAINKLDELGLRKKLIQLGDKSIPNSFAWWLNREPLRSSPVGLGKGKTAENLNIDIVAHETNNFLAYESITRSHSGEPNVLISRANEAGEQAVHGEGFYTKQGKKGARGTGLTIRFKVNPIAREGTDFFTVGDFIVFKNKKALQVIQESLNFDISDLLNLAESHQQLSFEKSNLALLEKLKRKLNATKINNELNKLLNSNLEKDHARLVQILNSLINSGISNLLDNKILEYVVKNIFDRTSPLMNSKSASDQLKFVRIINPIISVCESLKLINKEQLFGSIEKIINTRSFNFEIRKQAFFEFLLLDKYFTEISNSSIQLTSIEMDSMTSEISKWSKSEDPRKLDFVKSLERYWLIAIKNGNIKNLEILHKYRIRDLNFKNISKVSILQLAAYYKQNELTDWLISNNNFDLNSKNKLGYNEIEQLLLSGNAELAEKIIQQHPEVEVSRIYVKAKNPDGSPIIDFIRIESGSFMMGPSFNIFEVSDNRVQTTISAPFQILSVPTTQKIYQTILKLILETLPENEYKPLVDDFKEISNNELMPQVSLSYLDVSLWTRGLTELSKIKDEDIQQILKHLLPGHKLGDIYRLPTEAEWEYMARLGGLAESNYTFGNTDSELDDHVVYFANSANSYQPVGTKKPVFYNGKPIYDITGNISEWTSDWYGAKLQGGRDPKGAITGTTRILRGGSWAMGATQMLTSFRFTAQINARYPDNGFRLVRNH